MPDDVDPRDLAPEAPSVLRPLTKEHADVVAKHLVMAERLLDDDPEQALAHARAARALAGRVGVVREANGLVAYAAGEWTEALSELRTARRITGDPGNLPVMADCERALGRADRALMVSEDPQAARLSPAARVEMMIVASGARRDLGQADAAVLALQVPALDGPIRPWTVRLRYAYADALLDAGREDDARAWFALAAEIDEHGETDADERLLELDGVVFGDEEQDLDVQDLPERDSARSPSEVAADRLSGADLDAISSSPTGPGAATWAREGAIPTEAPDGVDPDAGSTETGQVAQDASPAGASDEPALSVDREAEASPEPRAASVHAAFRAALDTAGGTVASQHETASASTSATLDPDVDSAGDATPDAAVDSAGAAAVNPAEDLVGTPAERSAASAVPLAVFIDQSTLPPSPQVRGGDAEPQRDGEVPPGDVLDDEETGAAVRPTGPSKDVAPPPFLSEPRAASPQEPDELRLFE